MNFKQVNFITQTFKIFPIVRISDAILLPGSVSATIISDIPKYLQRKFLSQLTFSGNKYLYDDLDHIITVHNFLNYFSRLHKIGKKALTQKILNLKKINHA